MGLSNRTKTMTSHEHEEFTIEMIQSEQKGGNKDEKFARIKGLWSKTSF